MGSQAGDWLDFAEFERRYWDLLHRKERAVLGPDAPASDRPREFLGPVPGEVRDWVAGRQPILVIVDDPGRGKTRLLLEAIRRLSQRVAKDWQTRLTDGEGADLDDDLPGGGEGVVVAWDDFQDGPRAQSRLREILDRLSDPASSVPWRLVMSAWRPFEGRLAEVCGQRRTLMARGPEAPFADERAGAFLLEWLGESVVVTPGVKDILRVARQDPADLIYAVDAMVGGQSDATRAAIQRSVDTLLLGGPPAPHRAARRGLCTVLALFGVLPQVGPWSERRWIQTDAARVQACLELEECGVLDRDGQGRLRLSDGHLRHYIFAASLDGESPFGKSPGPRGWADLVAEHLPEALPRSFTLLRLAAKDRDMELEVARVGRGILDAARRRFPLTLLLQDLEGEDLTPEGQHLVSSLGDLLPDSMLKTATDACALVMELWRARLARAASVVDFAQRLLHRLEEARVGEDVVREVLDEFIRPLRGTGRGKAADRLRNRLAQAVYDEVGLGLCSMEATRFLRCSDASLEAPRLWLAVVEEWLLEDLESSPEEAIPALDPDDRVARARSLVDARPNPTTGGDDDWPSVLARLLREGKPQGSWQALFAAALESLSVVEAS